MTTSQMIRRNIADSIYYKKIGNDEASEFFFNQAVLIANGDTKTLEICALIETVNQTINH